MTPFRGQTQIKLNGSVPLPGGFVVSAVYQNISGPPIEANYAASVLEWARQTYAGRMDFAAVTTTMVEDLLGRRPVILGAWVARNSKAVLEAGAR